MEKYRHQLEEMGRVDPALGVLHHLIMNHDNRSYAAVYEDEGSGEQRFLFNGRVVARHRKHDCENFALSYDGTKLAVTKGRRHRGQPGEIYVNGELAFTVPFDTIHHLVWLDNDRLAWDCWNDTDLSKRRDKIKWRQELAAAQGVSVNDLPPDPELEESGIRFFINGSDWTADFCFECYWAELGRYAMSVREREWVYYMDDSGQRSRWEPPVLMEDGRFSFDHHRNNCPAGKQRWQEIAKASQGERPEPLAPDADACGLSLRQMIDHGLLMDDRENGRVVWRGQAGPQFDGLENGGGFRTYAFNADNSRLAYVGIRYGEWAKGIMKVVGPLIEKACDRESRGGKPPWWGWPLAMLFNPYMGLGYAASEASRRWYPVDNGQAWKKGYEFANNHFYTPDNELVVTCRQGGKVMVVINEQEGPTFDEVCNVRCLEDGQLCYLARKGDRIFRVTVR